MNARRTSTHKSRRTSAGDNGLSTAERLSMIEATLIAMQSALETQVHRIVALQAEIDYLAAKVGSRR